MSTTHADATPCSTTCSCKIASQARSAWTLGLALALLTLALVSTIERRHGGVAMILAGAYLLQIWYTALPPATVAWWKQPRVWLGILGALLGLAALVAGVTGGLGHLGESLNP